MNGIQKEQCSYELEEQKYKRQLLLQS